MAKTGSDSSAAVLSEGTGGGIYEEALQAAAELANYVVGESRPTYFSLDVSHFDVAFRADNTPAVRFQTWINIDADEQSLALEAHCTIPVGSQDCRVQFTIGGGSTTLIFTSTGYQTGTLSIASVGGTGWRQVTVTLTHQTGSNGSCQLNFLRCQGARIAAASLPDPTG